MAFVVEKPSSHTLPHVPRLLTSTRHALGVQPVSRTMLLFPPGQRICVKLPEPAVQPAAHEFPLVHAMRMFPSLDSTRFDAPQSATPTCQSTRCCPSTKTRFPPVSRCAVHGPSPCPLVPVSHTPRGGVPIWYSTIFPSSLTRSRHRPSSDRISSNIIPPSDLSADNGPPAPGRSEAGGVGAIGGAQGEAETTGTLEEPVSGPS
mmetsp:Transcript_30850/g.73301  ORF Transcript_30850/g.73301 Transcript_30850/m.73301 type:complete len:204 (-) Transcript_30850:2593-3204(-)